MIEGRELDKTGADLAADLHSLWRCGRELLPAAAECFIEANKAVAGTGGDSGAFQRPGTMAGGVTGSVSGQVYPVWDELRDEFQRLLAQNAENLYATAEALIRVADMYAESDTTAKDVLERTLREQGFDYHNGATAQRRPPELPE